MALDPWGYRAIRLDTVSTSENVINLYRRLGFRDIDRYDDNPKPDGFMELEPRPEAPRPPR